MQVHVRQEHQLNREEPSVYAWRIEGADEPLLALQILGQGPLPYPGHRYPVEAHDELHHAVDPNQEAGPSENL